MAFGQDLRGEAAPASLKPTSATQLLLGKEKISGAKLPRPH